MFRKIVAVILLVCYCLVCWGCYSNKQVPVSQAIANPTYRIAKVIRTDGEIVSFYPHQPTDYYTGQKRWGVLQDSTVGGWIREGGREAYVEIPFSDIHTLVIRKFDAWQTAFASFMIPIGLLVVAVAIALATKDSCPFVYSYDGSQYWFDGEPYGGATCPGLQRTDYCRLDSLRPVDGRYRLLLTNEVDETQHTDEIKLWVVDHPADVQVLPDGDGQLYTLGSIEKPRWVTASDGSDESLWLKTNDLLWWESDKLMRDPKDPASLRDSLTLCFPKPVEADSAKLVVTAGTTLWGSQMLKQYEELWGDQLEVWHGAIANPLGRQMLEIWNHREEVYSLQVRVWANGNWVERGEILGGGPFLVEDRVVPLNLEGVVGDSLCILLTPPTGFWQMNSFAMDYSPEIPIRVQEIAPDSALGHQGDDIRAILASSDGIYYSAPDVGQTAELSFIVPSSNEYSARTVFIKASGYYDIHHSAVSAKQDSIINRINYEPGYFTRYAMEKYQAWYESNLTARGK
jgi:hypothetical protein